MEFKNKYSGWMSDNCRITFACQLYDENPFTSVLNCMFYDNHVLKCGHVLTVNYQQSVNKYFTHGVSYLHIPVHMVEHV